MSSGRSKRESETGYLQQRQDWTPGYLHCTVHPGEKAAARNCNMDLECTHGASSRDNAGDRHSSNRAQEGTKS